MIKVSGTLAIRTIVGTRGPFNVGRLHTDIGEFAVKDSLIEEYDEGRYVGEFGIAGIFPSTYFAGGRTVVEVRARLGSIALEDIAELDHSDQAPMTEPDPIAETPHDATPDAAAEVATEAAADAEGESDARPAEDIESFEQRIQALFGELWPLQPKLKLDPTVDRERFRQQRDLLKTELGYRFQPVGQVWVKA
ncbi:MAG: DUF3275 family protein [Pseudomonadota bacterium]|nr:DUF3275 family protein [Pseudomonadota bacterium]